MYVMYIRMYVCMYVCMYASSSRPNAIYSILANLVIKHECLGVYQEVNRNATYVTKINVD
jgi:hypothetical protein